MLSLLLTGLALLGIICCLALSAYQSVKDHRLRWYWRVLTLLLGGGLTATIAALEFVEPLANSGEMPPLLGLGMNLTLLGVACTVPGIALLAWRKMRRPAAKRAAIEQA